MGKCHLRTIWCLAVFCLISVVLSACGYHRIGRSEAIPSWIKTIYIAPFSNHSNELLLGTWITDALRREFLRGGGGIALASKENADVILEGDIVRVDTTGLSYLTYSQTVERRISVDCALRIIDRKTGQVLWQTTNLQRDEGFLVGQEMMQTEGFKEEALKQLSRYMAELIYHRITEVF